MNSGYEKFFEEARKANGRVGGQGDGVKSRPSKVGAKPEFKIKERQGATANSAEDRLKLAVSQRVARRKSKARSRRQKKMPVFAVACVTALLGFGVYSYQVPGVYDSLAKRVDWLGQHFEFSAFGLAEAADGESAPGKTAIKERVQVPKDGESDKGSDKSPSADKKSGAKSEKSADGGKDAGAKSAGKEGSEKSDSIANIKNWTPEELSFFNKLSDRKKELDRRETELNKLDEELQKQKAELDEKIKQLEKMRADIGQTLKARVTTDQEKVDKLVQVYSNMKPQNAAKVIETLNETLAVEVLDKMKKKNAAEILNVMETKKAQRLSEILAGYKGPET